MPITVEGGTEEQRDLLTSILGDLGESTVEAIGLEGWVDDFEEHTSLGLVPTADEIEEPRGTAVRLLRPDPPLLRAQWEARLVADAFRIRSAKLGLEQVVVLHSGDGSTTLPSTPELTPPLTLDEIARMRDEITAAVASAGADLRDMTVLRPAGHALALSVRVAEPHAFLRQHFRSMVELLEPWTEACGRQRYIEICDGELHPALVSAQYAYGGMSSVRRDVSCCSPLVSLGEGIDAPPTPPCPVFG
jgi:hypothetical protein